MIPPAALPHALNPVVALCRDAAAAILDVYDGSESADVDWKADRTPVTNADRAAHAVLTGGLRSLGSDVPVLSEEGTRAEWDAAARAPAFWLVDPLDGTKEFLKRTGEFTVNVARVEGGHPVLGVVLQPVTGQVWAATLEAGGPGAWRLDPDGRVTALATRVPPATPLRLAASRDHAGPLVEAIERDHPDAVTLTRAGSSLKFCRVAEGAADLYLRDGRTMEWDTAAADCIVEAAGGRVCSFDGDPLQYGQAPYANPSFVAVGDPSLDWRRFISSASNG
jgi:3'(2'), 5'-bisphosphate nucleotidase